MCHERQSLNLIAMSRNGKGLGEISANKRRGATSKKALSLAAKSHHTAKVALMTAKKVAFKNAEDAFKIMEAVLKVAQNDMDDARKDEKGTKDYLRDSEKCLDDARKRWEVIDLVDDNTTVNEPSKVAAKNCIKTQTLARDHPSR